MGSITRGLSNNITTDGVIAPAGITNSTVANITSFPNASGGTLILLSTQTASNSATISFTSGLDSTYDAYEFKFINIQPRTDAVGFQFNFSTDGGSNYNVTKQSSSYRIYHNEAGTTYGAEYISWALAQSTSFQRITGQLGNGADECCSGTFQLFNPSSTTYVKHYISTINTYTEDNYSERANLAGYGNTTSAINAIRFQMGSGNFDGIIKLYGVKKS